VTIELYAMLSEPFPREMERTVSKGGRNLTYIPISEVISRLNKVLGLANWSFEIVSIKRDAIDSDWVVAHVRLTATIDGVTITKDGVGGQQVKYTKAGKVLDLGDEFKGAMSDALKKAAQQLGVGLYLARDDAAMEIEASMETPPPDPQVSDLFDRLVALSKSLDEYGRSALEDFWIEYGNGEPKPTRTTAKVADLEALIAEAARLTMGGEFDDSGS
jgi:recombination DNA repair RAD52 pathway protein